MWCPPCREPPSAFTSQAKVTAADPAKRAEAATASPRATPLAATAEPEATEGDKHRPAAKADEGAARRQRAPRGPLEEARADATDVLDGWLFLGGQRAAASRKALQDLGVTHVLNCCSRIPCKFPNVFKYAVVEIFDTKHADLAKSAGMERSR